MLGVVGLQWFFMDRGSLQWFVVGLCDGSVSFNFSGFDWFWWFLDFGGWVCGLIGVALGAGCGLIRVVLGLCCDFVILLFEWFFDFMALDVEVWFFFFFFGCGDGGWMWWLWYGWVDMVADGTRLWKRDIEERETEKERGRIKNDKERIFKWSVKKNRIFDVRDFVKWCIICYKIEFWDGKW